MSDRCSMPTEGRSKTCFEEKTFTGPDPCCSPHSESLSPGTAGSGGTSQTRPNNVDSDRATFHWSDWSPRVARLNAPREDGAKLIEPPLQLADEIASINRNALRGSDYDVQGRTLPQLAAEAHAALLSAALQYTRGYRDVSVPANSAGLVLAGHQPEMFHPGVWFKNFVLAQLAKQCNAVAVNLQIDSDAMKSASLRVPGGSVDQPRLEYISFDRGAQELPFEQRAIIDRECFVSFGKRAGNHLRQLVQQPLLERYWPLAVARAKATNNIGASLSQARHQCESAWGLQTLEIPQSHVCDLPPMRWFMMHLLAHLPRFWEIHNSALLEYRHEHKVRSAAHPVPELDTADGWLEAPLWIWSQSAPRRRPLFVCQQEDELLLSDRGQLEITLSITPEGDATRALEQLDSLSAKGIRLRTRALITTMAARLLLGDLFVHGIGGAKYDQLTDRIIARFFGFEPPGYLVASGTLHLPISRPAVTSESVPQIRQRIRELEFHPERFLDQSGAAGNDGNAPDQTTALVAEKLHLLSMSQTSANARQRCRAIRHINEALQPSVAGLRELWTSQADLQADQRRLEALLRSREYAFTLFPEPILTNFLLPVLEISSRNG